MIYYIWSYEHNAWWRPNHHGYTTDLRQAGRYGQSDACLIVASANQCGEINEAYVSIDAFNKGSE